MNKIKETLTKVTASAVELKDRLLKKTVSFIPVMTDTLGPEVVLVSTRTFVSQVTKPDTIYVVKHIFDLQGGCVELPQGCTLEFQGGGLLVNGILVGHDGVIHADRKIFDNVQVLGSWRCVGNVGWFAYITEDADKAIDDHDSLQHALDSSFTELVFPPAMFYTSETLFLRTPKRLILHGVKMRWPLIWDTAIKNTSVIFTDKDIDLLVVSVDGGIKTNAIEITGGNFDTSMAAGYGSSVITVMADETQKIWGLDINTNIMGAYLRRTGIGINLNPTEMRTVKANAAYITNVHINSDITYFGTGVKATQWGDDKNWLTDIYIDGNIRFCPCAIETSADCVISASIQAGKFWDVRQNNRALIYVKGSTTAAISSNIFDIYQAADEANDIEPYSNRYAVIVEAPDGQDTTTPGEATRCTSTVLPFGKFEAFLVGTRFHHVSMVQGRVFSGVARDAYYYGGSNEEKSARVIDWKNELYNKV